MNVQCKLNDARALVLGEFLSDNLCPLHTYIDVPVGGKETVKSIASKLYTGEKLHQAITQLSKDFPWASDLDPYCRLGIRQSEIQAYQFHLKHNRAGFAIRGDEEFILHNSGAYSQPVCMLEDWYFTRAEYFKLLVAVRLHHELEGMFEDLFCGLGMNEEYKMCISDSLIMSSVLFDYIVPNGKE